MNFRLHVQLLFLLFPIFYLSQIIVQPTAIGHPGDQPIQQNTLLLPFSELDKSKIETGILLDAGFEFETLKKYSGVFTATTFSEH